MWWSRRDWAEFEVPQAVAAHHDVCRQYSVAPDTVVRVAREMSQHADHVTGRECRPTNERLVELLRVSLSTVQRARRVLKALRLVVETVAGRSFMTLAERARAWHGGSSHRRVAAEFALCSRPDRVPGPRSQVLPVDDDTPPVGTEVTADLTSRSTHLRARTENCEEEDAPRPAPTSTSRRRPTLDPRSRRLAEAVRLRLWWLRAVSAARMTPTLHRLAVAGWDARDVETAVRQQMAARGWRKVPATLLQPAAYLAGLLRDVDPLDRPGAFEEHMAAVEAAQAAYERRLIWGPPCPHGQPAGAELSPLRRIPACPSCRATAPPG